MGGGDLNSKKSWHPNTMKNQERVWKAEQAMAEEKNRMLELQRERAAERDRAELNDLMMKNNTANDNRLSWMYDKPDKKVEQEAYLLGKALDKNASQSDKAEDTIPAVSRRVVGSSMLTTAGDTQVDMSRKIREDPLLLIKERERAARAALLNNPLQRRKIAELLRKEQDLRNESKIEKKLKKKSKDLDNMLAAKLNALGGQKGVDLATLLNSDDSSSDSSTDSEVTHKKKKKHKSKHKKNKTKKKTNHSSNSDSESIHKNKKISYEIKKSKKPYLQDDDTQNTRESRKRKSSENCNNSYGENKSKKYKRNSSREDYSRRNSRTVYKKTHQDDRGDHSRRDTRRKSSPDVTRQRTNEDPSSSSKKSRGLSDKEKAARLAEMAVAGAEREVQRSRRVAEQRAAEPLAAEPLAARRLPPAALPLSLESRIHSNRHYIQRDKRHMNEHFARR